MKQDLLEKLNYRLSKLEAKVFGVPEGQKIELSPLGLKTFPELKNAQFRLIKQNRGHSDFLVVKRVGRKSTAVYHKNYFII